jgi:hypothetical protein
MSEHGSRDRRPHRLDYQAEPPLIRTEPFGWKDIVVIAFIVGAPVVWIIVRMLVWK